ncbi:hypothetical protein EHS25_007860 [Saitozyma podzolica]|uniref:Uncharacterized protein n=1 Tax=Saitozyma podzolica TaxID=1890683 RepID=A0A427YQW1_9TREE|nr:hypothetical protein EHS25_007860 [Saitozyma podzolica]
MSILPQYQRIPDNDNDDVHPGGKDTRLSFGDSDSQPPGYPPEASSSSAAIPASQSTGPSVIYSFRPRYPVQAERQHAMGVLFPTRAGATDFAQRTFPVLANYPPERIEFLLLVDVPDAHHTSKSWVIASDEAWVGFGENPPARIRVQVADGPKDAKRLESPLMGRTGRERKACIVISIIAASLVGVLLLVAAIGLAASMKHSHSRRPAPLIAVPRQARISPLWHALKDSDPAA